MGTPSEARMMTREVIDLILGLSLSGDLTVSGFTKNIVDETITGVTIRISPPIKISDLEKVKTQ